MWKFVVIFLVILSLGIFGFTFYNANTKMQEAGIKTESILSPFSKLTGSLSSDDKEANKQTGENGRPLGDPINILLLGIDRRSKSEFSFRTDIMIMLSINPDQNRVTIASIPRDLWYNGQKLNGLYDTFGWEAMQTAMETITGQKPERFILTDFQDFSWIVDAMGGVPVSVDRSFTDTSFPNDITKGYETVTFAAGPEKLTGERALIYARSRKGDNGEGSDWARMRRQHKILVGMLDAVEQPGSLFKPMVVEEAFKSVTTNRMDTNLKLSDAKYLWDFYKDKDLYTISSLYLDYQYLYTPPAEDYGGAWTVVPNDGDYSTFKKDLSNQLFGTAPVSGSDDADSQISSK